MLACVDVDYRDEGRSAVAACVVFGQWYDERPISEKTALISPVAPYVPGEFYRRELPCILQVLREIDAPLDAVIVDGYVWLDDLGTPGLGGHLFAALHEQVAVIGVAKTRFRGAAHASEVLRGASTSPLYVTSAGLDVSPKFRMSWATDFAHAREISGLSTFSA